MIIYKDLFSGDELFCDQFKMELLHGCLYKVTATLQKQDTGIDESKFGFNASAEGCDADEGAEDGVKYVIDVVDNHKLVETQYGKKDYQSYIKGYMKRVKSKLEEEKSDELEVFTSNAPTAVKFLLGKFKELCFYVGENMDYEAMVPVCESIDEKTSVFYFFKHGLIEEKV